MLPRTARCEVGRVRGGDNLGSPKLKGGKGGEPPAALRGGSGLGLQGQAGLTREFSYFLKNIYF